MLLARRQKAGSVGVRPSVVATRYAVRIQDLPCPGPPFAVGIPLRKVGGDHPLAALGRCEIVILAVDRQDPPLDNRIIEIPESMNEPVITSVPVIPYLEGSQLRCAVDRHTDVLAHTSKSIWKFGESP